jgi:hypothetical protein
MDLTLLAHHRRAHVLSSQVIESESSNTLYTVQAFSDRIKRKHIVP